MLLFRVSQNFSNGCFFFCPLSLFCLASVTEADLIENKKRFGAVHENGNTHTSAFNFVQRINNFSKFLDKKLSLCSTDFLFLPFIHVPQPESLWGVHSVDLLYFISFEGSISLTSFSGALFFSSFFPHVSALRGGCSSRAQLHLATYYYTQTLLTVLWFDAKASRFLFSLQDGLSVTKSSGIMASITHSCLQLMQCQLFSASSLFISD